MSRKALELCVLNVKPAGKTKEITISRKADRQMHAVTSLGFGSDRRKFLPPSTSWITYRANQIAFQETMTGSIEVSAKNPPRGQFGQVRPSARICGNY